MVVAPRMLVAAGLVCQALGARRGVILWSHGRTASDALAGTLKDSANFSYCNGLREGFGNKHDSSLISKEALDACRDRGEMLTHVMPVFLAVCGIYTPSSRHSYGDHIASMAWGARNF